MAVTLYPNSQPRDLKQKLGERVSVLDFGAVADGTTDNTTAFQDAYNSMVSMGGGAIYIPGSLTGQPYKINSSISMASNVHVVWRGDGRASKVIRGGTITAGVGLWDLANAQNITFYNFLVDGNVTTSTGMLYSAITGGDPMITALTQNSSFWVHGGNNIKWDSMWIEHTGGYAILLDARSINITDVSIFDSWLRNNRPHLFGTSSGDLNYGSWTGGIFYKNDGVTNVTAVIGLHIRGCVFERNTGNCVWGHGYGFAAQHQNIKVDSCSFLDCGLDGILHGNTVIGSADNNHFRRIGFICTDDTSASIPKWGAVFATAIDTTGVLKDGSYCNNIFLDVNGDCVNGDGFCHGLISNNTMRIAASGTPEYTQDSVSTMGPGGAGVATQGIILNNSNNFSEAGQYIEISGNRFFGMPGTEIGCFATRNSHIFGNFLYCPNAKTSGQYPIVLGNVGSGGAQRAYANYVHSNVIYYSPSGKVPCVFEEANGFAFNSGDANWVVGNTVVTTGNAFEFQKDANTTSVSAMVLSTMSSSVAHASTHFFQREGYDTSSALKIYYVQDTSSYQHAQFQAYSLGNSTRSPLFNVSEAGTGGAFTTGSRTTLPWTDAMATGKLYGDSFYVLTDATYSDTDANAENVVVGGGSTGTAVVALFRYKGSVGHIELSTTISSGSRVWTDITAGTGYWTQTSTWLYPNNSGWNVFVGRTTDDGSGARFQVGTGHGDSIASINAWNIIQTIAPTSSGVTFTSGYWNGTSNVTGTFTVNGVGACSMGGPLTVSGWSGNFGALFGLTTDNGGHGTVQVHGNIWLDINTVSQSGQAFGAATAGTGGDSTIIDDGGFEGNFFRIKAKKNLASGDYFDWTMVSPVSPFNAIGNHIIQFRNSSNAYVLSFNELGTGIPSNSNTAGNSAGLWNFIGGIAANNTIQSSVTGTSVGFQVNGGAGGSWLGNGLLGIANLNIGTSGVIQWNGSTVIAFASSVTTFTGGITATQTIQSNETGTGVGFQVNGGSGGQWLGNGTIGIAILNLSSTGTIEWNSTDYLRVSAGVLQFWNGSIWQAVGTGGASGVSSITGTANQVLANSTSGSAQTGAVTLTTPQDIATASTPTFAGLTLNGAAGYRLQVTAGGIEMSDSTGSFNILSASTANNAFNASNGGITSHSGYWIGATQVIDSSGHWVGTTIVTNVSAGTGISGGGSGSITITNAGVTSAIGTASQVLVNSSSGSAITGQITLSLPQSIGTGNVPQFQGLTLNQGNDSSGYQLQVNGGIEMANSGDNIFSKGSMRSDGGYYVSTTQVIDASTNIASTGWISAGTQFKCVSGGVQDGVTETLAAAIAAGTRHIYGGIICL